MSLRQVYFDGRRLDPLVLEQVQVGPYIWFPRSLHVLCKRLFYLGLTKHLLYTRARLFWRIIHLQPNLLCRVGLLLTCRHLRWMPGKTRVLLKQTPLAAEISRNSAEDSMTKSLLFFVAGRYMRLVMWEERTEKWASSEDRHRPTCRASHYRIGWPAKGTSIASLNHDDSVGRVTWQGSNQQTNPAIKHTQDTNERVWGTLNRPDCQCQATNSLATKMMHIHNFFVI